MASSITTTGAKASAQGRNYVSDGKSHLMEFKVNDVAMGENGSELQSGDSPATVKVTAKVAARLNEKPNPDIQKRRLRPEAVLGHRARAHRRHARSAGRSHRQRLSGREAEHRRRWQAAGRLASTCTIERSSWVALRILPSSHTNPIFVLVDGKPIRASAAAAPSGA